MKRCIVILVAGVLTLAVPGYATIINVPGDQHTIQEGIGASIHGDTVRVATGTYVENINFSGKNIVVGSWFLDAGDTSFISSTIIDGGASGSVVTFENGEDNNAIITGFRIQNGLASFGGGIWCDHSSPTISNNTISGNSADDYGGGINCNYSSATISNNTINGNSAYWRGGGIYCHVNSSPTISNNTISGNSSGVWGGGIYCWYSSPTISNNTISGNSAGDSGGGICGVYSSPVITNTIFWADSAPYGPEIDLFSGSPVITYCDVQGGWEGDGNIDCDPMFCDLESGDFYLDAASCCVGAGEGGVDIGAFGVGCGEEIPTLSEWGMLILGLLLLAIGTIAVIRRRKEAVANEHYRRNDLSTHA